MSKKVSTTESSEKTISDGSFVLIEYTAKEKETGKVFDTTYEEIAKKEKIFEESASYGAKLIIIGEGWYIKGFEEKLKGLKESEQKELEVPPEDAFGSRDASKIEQISLRKLVKAGIDVRPGIQIRIGNRIGTILRVGAGRVTVDFNPPLAGKTLVYDVKIVKILDKKEDKIKHLIKRRLRDLDIEKIQLKFKKNELTINLPDDVLYYSNVEVAKRGISSDIFKYIENIEIIRFVEEVKKEGPSQPEEPSDKAEK